MPPARGASRHFDGALRVGGQQVFVEVFGGRVELRQAAFVYMLGWVTPPSLGGELTDLGIQKPPGLLLKAQTGCQCENS